ncbi:hypothetical protein KP509_28G057400 [Ceratopteris richardii]|uniref:Tf2-1-like SH3-like domain-containing protein n=1 Tax=Ceratopteris richardii TaxID=49495 RepID=A0A8T2RCE0_CERRI|nr:hypothetical protein KP509_28G057400 [Ceratopteris richardii]
MEVPFVEPSSSQIPLADVGASASREVQWQEYAKKYREILLKILDQFNLQQAIERMKAFVDQHRTPQTFQEVDQKPKLSPRFCGPWIIIKKLNDVTYKLQLPDNCKVHPVFHVSKLRPYTSRDENCVDGLVALENRPSQPDVPFHFLDKREWKLQNRSIREYLEAWTSPPLIDATWESESLIHKHFPSLITEDNDL